MKKLIWKHHLRPTPGTQYADLPKSSEILSINVGILDFGLPADYIEMYFLCDTSQEETEERMFEVFKTGESISWDMGTVRTFLGSVKAGSENTILHIFERV